MIRFNVHDIKYYQNLSSHERALLIAELNNTVGKHWRETPSSIVVTINTKEGLLDVPLSKIHSKIPGIVDRIPCQLDERQLEILHARILHDVQAERVILDNQGGAAFGLGAFHGIETGILTVYIADFNLYYKFIPKQVNIAIE